MSTLSNAVDVLIFCLCFLLFLFSSAMSPMQEASLEPVRAPVREALLETRAAQVHHPTPGEGRFLVESPEVSGGGNYMEGHAPSPCGLPWKYWLLWRALKSWRGLLPPAPDPGVSGWVVIEGLQAFLHACVHVLALCFLRGLLLTSLFLTRSWLSSLWQKQTTGCLYSISTPPAYQRPSVEPQSGALLTLSPCLYVTKATSLQRGIRPARKHVHWRGHIFFWWYSAYIQPMLWLSFSYNVCPLNFELNNIPRYTTLTLYLSF